MTFLAIACIVALCAAIVYAMKERGAAGTAQEKLRASEAELESAAADTAALSAMRVEMRGREEQLSAEQRLAAEREKELERLRLEQKEDRATVSNQSQEIKLLKDAIDGFKKKQDELANSTMEAAGANRRIETTLLDWTRQIANPQGRGAFGELALQNQLVSLGLEEGRDFDKQATPEAGGRQRVDFIVRLGDPVVAIDSKLAQDPGIAGLSEALAAGDPDRLKDFGRKLRDHAKALASRDYWRNLDQSPSLTLMYVPIEGASHALAALDDFDGTKFFNTHRVCVVTPSQLPLALILIAEVCHAERKEEHIEELLSRGYSMADAISKFLDNYAKLGKKLGESVSAYNSGAAMTTSHGQVWQQVVKPLSELAPGRSIESKAKELEPPRDDVVDLAERYRETSEKMRLDESDAA
ncbi:MAG: recombination protein RmuC [Solirubrobacterales bacterium]|jgi:DNA anti-recombination protein RmuC|nr:recombination protein RmuC [Solirubrobacterales bacterium]